MALLVLNWVGLYDHFLELEIVLRYSVREREVSLQLSGNRCTELASKYLI
jgi:hypothetical protein